MHAHITTIDGETLSYFCFMQISMSVRVMTPTTVMRMHSALTQWEVIPAPATLATLETGSTARVRKKNALL